MSLPSGPWCSMVARALTSSALTAWGVPGLTAVAEQLVAELAANAAQHTGGIPRLLLERRPGRIRIEVRDASRALPCLILGELGDENGRGLRLVDALADRWGADVMPFGKSVWFELRTPRASKTGPTAPATTD